MKMPAEPAPQPTDRPHRPAGCARPGGEAGAADADARGTADAGAADAPAALPALARPVGDQGERCGELRLARYRKDDGRALLLYRHAGDDPA